MRVLEYFYIVLKVPKMSFRKESTRTDRPNFPPQRFLTKAILTARKSRQRRTKWWVGLKMDRKKFWPDFLSVNTLPPKSQCEVLDLSVLYCLGIQLYFFGGFIGDMGHTNNVQMRKCTNSCSRLIKSSASLIEITHYLCDGHRTIIWFSFAEMKNRLLCICVRV